MFFYLKIFLARNLDEVIDLADQYVFNGELEKIIEITYSYEDGEDDTFFNETLFTEFLGQSQDGNLEFFRRKYRYKIQVKMVLIGDIIAKAKKIKIHSRRDSVRRSMFIESLEYVKNIIEISLLGIDFELEKAGFEYRITRKKLEQKINKIESLEEKVFGKKMIHNTEEFSFCFNFIKRNHEKRKKTLGEKDRKAMKKYLRKIEQSKQCDLIDTPCIKIKRLKSSFLKKEIPRKDYRKIFDSVCELYNLPQRTILTSASSIYDGDNFLEIPRDEAHANFSIERLLKLLTHEIESHYINGYNGRLLVGNFRGAKNLPKEEGLAMFMERIFQGYTYENIDNIVESSFTMIAGECLIGENFEDFMRIMQKEYKCKQQSYKKIVLRSKRNYSLKFPGVQHKDVAYFRGLMDIIEYLKTGGEFRKLFLGKVGFHDVDNLFSIYQSFEEKEKIVSPIFISDLIFYYFTNKQREEDFEFNTQEYYLYIKKKYWFLDLGSFKIISQVDEKWKKIERILRVLEKEIL